VRPADAHSLADALSTLTGDSGARRNMASAARPWIERSFTLENMVQQMTQTYHEAIALHAGR